MGHIENIPVVILILNPEAFILGSAEFDEVGHVMTYPISRLKMWGVLVSVALLSSLLLLVGWLGTCYYYRYYVIMKVSIEWKDAILLLIIFLSISWIQTSIIFASFLLSGSKEHGIISAFIILVIIERISTVITNLTKKLQMHGNPRYH